MHTLEYIGALIFIILLLTSNSLIFRKWRGTIVIACLIGIVVLILSKLGVLS